MDEWCSYCGEPLPMITDKNREWVEKGFCTEAHMYLACDEEDLEDDEDYFDPDREELDSLIKEEMRTRDGRLPMFKGEGP